MQKMLMMLRTGVAAAAAAGTVLVTGAVAAPTLAGASASTGGKISLWQTRTYRSRRRIPASWVPSLTTGWEPALTRTARSTRMVPMSGSCSRRARFEADASVLDQKPTPRRPALDNPSTCPFAFSNGAHYSLGREGCLRRHLGHRDRHGAVCWASVRATRLGKTKGRATRAIVRGPLRALEPSAGPAPWPSTVRPMDENIAIVDRSTRRSRGRTSRPFSTSRTRTASLLRIRRCRGVGPSRVMRA